MKDKDITSETRIRLTLPQLWACAVALVTVSTILVRAHSGVMDRLTKVSDGIEALVEQNKKIDQKFELYSLKKQVGAISVYLFKEFNRTNHVDENEFKEEIARILTE